MRTGLACPAPRRATTRAARAGWPLQLLGALLAIVAIGDFLLTRIGHRARGVEWLALSWTLGAGGLTLGMLWLNAAGVGLRGQQMVLAALAGLWLSIRLLRLGRGWTRRGRETPRTAHQNGGEVWRWSPVLVRSLWLLIGVHVACVVMIAMGRPLQAWDSWVNWGSKARVMFIEGGLTPAVYADPSRAVTLPDYPLFLPLLEAWIYRWIGAPDDRLVGIVAVLFYLTLIALCYSTVRRWGGSQLLAAAASAVMATMTNVVLTAAVVFADVPLAVFAVVAATCLTRWLDDGPPATLAAGAVAAGLLPWIKHEGWLLLGALCLTMLLVSRGERLSGSTRRAWLGAGASILAALLLANLHRLPVIAAYQLRNLSSPDWNFVWPLALVLAILLWWRRSRSAGDQRRLPIGLLPLTALAYLLLTSLAYVFSDFVPSSSTSSAQSIG